MKQDGNVCLIKKIVFYLLTFSFYVRIIMNELRLLLCLMIHLREI